MMKKCLFFLGWLGLSTSYAADATPSALASCVSCHGKAGISPVREVPNLAGQYTSYMLKQMQNYQSGVRKNPIMQQVLVNVPKEELTRLARYFAKLPPPQGKTPAQYVALGERLYRGGNLKTGVPACLSCHGPSGIGNDLAHFPRIAGQHAEYTLSQLKAFRTGTRPDSTHIMPQISTKMTTNQMRAVAYYIQGLR